ncbi:MAG: hypothetical protein ACOCZ2_03595 [Thermodesulfobacteriota bacterium]
MQLTKPAAYILLLFLIAIIAHSTISLFQGKFVQATVMAPFLVVVYVFAVGRKRTYREEEEIEEEDIGENDDPEDRQ